MLEWVLSSGVLAIGSLMLGGIRSQRKRLERWQKIAESHGLEVVKISSETTMRLKLEAQAGPVTVRIEDSKGRPYFLQIKVPIQGPPGFSGVRIRRETYRPPGAREIEVGDDLFDGKFFVEGPSRLMSVLLDAETRCLLLSVDAGGVLEISRGEIRVETIEASVPDVLPLVLDIVRRFSQQVEIPQRLVENALQDTEAGVRLRNLRLLAFEFPGEPWTIEALRAACSDPAPQIRLRAAMELGAEGHNILLEFAESTANDIWSAQAVSRLGRVLPFERTRAVLDQALDRRHLRTVQACLDVLGQHGDAAAVDVLTKVMVAERGGELGVAAALALGATGSPAAEPPLLRVLQRGRPELQTAAATALGRTGSTAAVLPLKEAAENARDSKLRRAARQAIAEIQSRLPGASPGQLSLAGSEVGQLSLAQAEAGQLSLAQAEPGQLSILGEKEG